MDRKISVSMHNLNREVRAGHDCFVVYCPPPGQSSGPRKVVHVKAGGFIATSGSAWQDVLGPYATREEAVKAAQRDSERSGYPDATVLR